MAQYEDAGSSKRIPEIPETGEQPPVRQYSQQRTSYTSPETTNRGSVDSWPACKKNQDSTTQRSSNCTLSPSGSLAPGNQISGPPVVKAGSSYQQVGPGCEAQQSRRSSLVPKPQETNGHLHQTHFDDIVLNQNTNAVISQSFPISTSDTAVSNPPFITDDLGGELDLEWMIANTEVESRKSCSCSKSADESTELTLTKVNSLINQSSTARRPSYASSSRPPATMPRESLNERFESIMKCVGEMGFESFDDLVISYYTDDFEDASKLFHEQRFSRIRRLPGVFAEILDGARKWEPLERRGVGEEVLKEAETVLMLESSDAWQSLESITDEVITKDCISTEQLYQSFSTLLPIQVSFNHMMVYENKQRITLLHRLDSFKADKYIQMPKLWTLLMILVASDCPVWQRDSSGIALAITALLHFTGRIPKLKMLDLISLCLS